jgi:hypothetical protein
VKELGEGPNHTFSISLNKSHKLTHNNTHTTHKQHQHAFNNTLSLVPPVP